MPLCLGTVLRIPFFIAMFFTKNGSILVVFTWARVLGKNISCFRPFLVFQGRTPTKWTAPEAWLGKSEYKVSPKSDV